MTKNVLLLRLSEIEKTMQQLMADYNANEGARQEIKNWLLKLEKDEIPVET